MLLKPHDNHNLQSAKDVPKIQNISRASNMHLTHDIVTSLIPELGLDAHTDKNNC